MSAPARTSPINRRLELLQPYPFERYRALLAGVAPPALPLIRLSIGEPQHATPALVRAALVDVVEAEDGTAHAFAIPGLRYAGKTGTGEAPPKDGVEANDAWFVAYAPADRPAVLVAARVERADPKKDAKETVRRVLEAWRRGPTGATSPGQR